MALEIVRDVLEDQLAVIRTTLLGGFAGIYTNAETPDADSVIGDFDPPVWAGYADIATPSWVAIFADGQEEKTTHPNLSWINPGPGSVDIYGYYCVNALGDLVLAELFSGGPYTLVSGAGLILSLVVRQRSIP